MPGSMLGDGSLPPLPLHRAESAPVPLPATIHFAYNWMRSVIADLMTTVGAATSMDTCSYRIPNDCGRCSTQAGFRP